MIMRPEHFKKGKSGAEISTNELRLEFDRVLKALKQGRSLTLTYRNKPLARIVPIEEERVLREDDPIYDLRFAAERVAAAAQAAHAGLVPFVLTARAENYLHGRPDLADTITRLQAYQLAGADVLYAPGLRDISDIRQLIREVDRPVNVLAIVGAPPVPELAEAGTSRISVGGSFAFAALGALVSAATELRDQGTYGYQAASAVGRQAATQAFG